MDFIPIKVECHSGYKADEYPRCFYWRNQKYEVESVLDRWYQGDSNPEWPVADYFKVSVIGGSEFILRHEGETGQWYLLNPREPAVYFGNN